MWRSYLKFQMHCSNAGAQRSFSDRTGSVTGHEIFNTASFQAYSLCVCMCAATANWCRQKSTKRLIIFLPNTPISAVRLNTVLPSRFRNILCWLYAQDRNPVLYKILQQISIVAGN